MEEISNEPKNQFNIIKRGVKTIYREEMCDQVTLYMSQGMSQCEASARLGICSDTWYQWKLIHPEFAQAVKNGEMYAQAWWEKIGRENIHNKMFNSVLWYMNMKNRFGWSDDPSQRVIRSYKKYIMNLSDAKDLEEEMRIITNLFDEGSISDNAYAQMIETIHKKSEIIHNVKIIPRLRELEKIEKIENKS